MFECIHTDIFSLIKSFHPYRTKEVPGGIFVYIIQIYSLTTLLCETPVTDSDHKINTVDMIYIASSDTRFEVKTIHMSGIICKSR